MEAMLCVGMEWTTPDSFPEEKCALCRFEGVCTEIFESGLEDANIESIYDDKNTNSQKLQVNFFNVF
jgi:hypothetical protein